MNIPYICNTYNVRKIMFLVVLACFPGFLVELYFFGWDVLIQLFYFSSISLLFEFIALKLGSKNIKNHLFDNSFFVSSILLSLSIPPLLPLWIIFIGSFFSIIISKHLYGGLGQNIFNPAMIGYIVLLISFPLYINSWHKNNNDHCTILVKQKERNNNLKICPEFFTEATPLNNFKTKSHFDHRYQEKLIVKNDKTVISSCVYTNIGFLLGGLYLLYKKIICWRIPFSFLTVFTILSSISYFLSKSFFLSPLFHVFSGGTMMCAFFIATDPVTTASTNLGKVIFAGIIGILTWLIRNYSDYPDGVAFAVLFSNMLVPLIDYFIKTPGYGHKNI